VLLVQQVEDQTALEDFNAKHLGGRYDHVVVLEANDDRFIDVGVILRGALRLGGVTTWKHATHPEADGPIFSRDLLQADLTDARGETVLTIFNTHLESHFVAEFDFELGRLKTAAEIAAEHAAANERRRMQAETAAAIITPHLDAPVILAGDMNDPPDSTALQSWVAAGLIDALTDAAETKPPPPASKPEDTPTTALWTHRFPQTNAPDHFELFASSGSAPRCRQRSASRGSTAAPPGQPTAATTTP
jgi:hypothetical protein